MESRSDDTPPFEKVCKEFLLPLLAFSTFKSKYGFS